MHLDPAKVKHIPDDLLLVVSYRCNSRCVMCGIWEGDQSGRGEMTPDEYRRIIPDSLTHINITGGETFLRKDLPEIVAAAHEAAPRAALTISTNGLQPSLTRRMFSRMRRRRRITAWSAGTRCSLVRSMIGPIDIDMTASSCSRPRKPVQFAFILSRSWPHTVFAVTRKSQLAGS